MSVQFCALRSGVADARHPIDCNPASRSRAVQYSLSKVAQHLRRRNRTIPLGAHNSYWCQNQWQRQRCRIERSDSAKGGATPILLSTRGTCHVHTRLFFEPQTEPAARCAASCLRNKAGIILASDIPPAAHIADRGGGKSSSSTVWNCNLHHGLVRCNRCRVWSRGIVGGGRQ